MAQTEQQGVGWLAEWRRGGPRAALVRLYSNSMQRGLQWDIIPLLISSGVCCGFDWKCSWRWISVGDNKFAGGSPRHDNDIGLGSLGCSSLGSLLFETECGVRCSGQDL